MYAIAKITHKKFHLIIGMFLDCTNHKLGWPKKCITRNFYHGPKPKIVIFWVRFNFKASIGYFRMLPVYKVVKIFGLGFHDFGQVWLNSPTLNGRTALWNKVGNFVHLVKSFGAIFYEWFGLKFWSSDLKKKLPG